MCGIIGYTGSSQALPVLVQGIRLLSYRGYDSAGVAIWQDGSLRIRKDKGRIEDLAPRWSPDELAGTTGIGHTRWATHGVPNQVNAHPQHDDGETVAVVHNGIIENDLALREALEADGVPLVSDTDTEVFAHLFARAFDGDPVAAARHLLEACHGAFALAIQHAAMPDTIIAVRRGSPLLVGVGVRENLVASDLRPLVGRADAVIDLGEDQIAIVTPDDVRLFDADGAEITAERRPIDHSERDIGKDGYPHFMLKEIHEQPDRIYELVASRIDPKHQRVRLEDVGITDEQWRAFDRVDLIGCGTAFHACLYGAYVLEGLAGIPSRALMAHEYDARKPHLDERVLAIAVSQSGETMDTKIAIQSAVDGGAHTLGVLNVRESVIGRTVNGVLDIHAGPEVAVASTKVYTQMLCGLLLLALRGAQARGTGDGLLAEIAPALKRLPDDVRTVLGRFDRVREAARDVRRAGDMLFLGRGFDAGTALEGALKMKEISYIHAEGYPAGEMKHGPIALVSREVPTVAIATSGPTRERMIGNVREVRARDGEIILVATDGDGDAEKLADFVLWVPEVHPLVAPVVNVVPLQLLSYETARLRGCDVDQPRNLAKTVTVQ
ncbi:MAG: glutamine--fructose-6-phosphate transaminase (isomerizing) [Planctomycetota bacterium]|nr:glutamine--fructose-6-phosphate transaminase (isomerizing) [Planctomycetota bacterium]